MTEFTYMPNILNSLNSLALVCKNAGKYSLKSTKLLVVPGY